MTAESGVQRTSRAGWVDGEMIRQLLRRKVRVVAYLPAMPQMPAFVCREEEKTLVKAMRDAFSNTAHLPKLKQPVPLVLSGGALRGVGRTSAGLPVTVQPA